MVIVILALTRRMADTPPDADAKLDGVGTALSALGLGMIVYGILRAGTWGLVQPKPEAPEWFGLSPVVWLILGGAAVLGLFMHWENRRLARGQAALIDPAMLDNVRLRGGLTSFFFQYLMQAGLFFSVPLFLSVALGLSAIATGVRLLPLSVTLLLAATLIPKLAPNASPRRVRAARLHRAVRRVRGHGGCARRGRGSGDRDVADAARRARRGCAGVAARRRHGVLGARLAERRDRRPPEHASPTSAPRSAPHWRAPS